MINGLVVGVVTDNKDPDGMHRVMVEFPVDSGEGLSSSWCRMMSPMAGKDRGLVILPDIGTEVVLMFAYRTLSPYIVGAVYNGAEDLPEPYHNDDGNDDKRVFWSRNDHMVIFDDTPGAERVDFGAQAPTRLTVQGAPIYHSMDSSQKTINEYCDKNTTVEAVENISIKCKDFKLETDMTVDVKAGQTLLAKCDGTSEIRSSGNQIYQAARVDINPSSPPPEPAPVLPTPAHSHPPTK